MRYQDKFFEIEFDNSNSEYELNCQKLEFNFFPEEFKKAFRIRASFITFLELHNPKSISKIILKEPIYLNYYLIKFIFWELNQVPLIEFDEKINMSRPNNLLLSLMHDFVIDSVKNSNSSTTNELQKVWRHINPVCSICESVPWKTELTNSIMNLDVLIPTKNVEVEHINLLISDIQNQIAFDDTIIVVDNNADHSILASQIRFDASKSRFEIYHFNSDNIAEIRNFAIAKSSANLLAFVDSDDRIDLTHLPSQINFHKRFPEVTATGTWLQAFGAHNHVYEQWDGFQVWGIKYCLPPAGVLMWKRQHLIELGCFDSRFSRGFEDFDLVARAISMNCIIVVRDFVSYKYKRGHASLSQSWDIESEKEYRLMVYENLKNLCPHMQAIFVDQTSIKLGPNFLDSFPVKRVPIELDINILISHVRKSPFLRKLWRSLPNSIRRGVLNRINS